VKTVTATESMKCQDLQMTKEDSDAAEMDYINSKFVYTITKSATTKISMICSEDHMKQNTSF
jgi:hypothetical protein